MRKSHACVRRREVHEMRLGMTFMADWNADAECAINVNHNTTLTRPNFLIPQKKGKNGEKKRVLFQLQLKKIKLLSCK
jgi:hypothetical protein